MKRVRAADLFCGAGGTSTGLIEACSVLGLPLDLTAVNHWPLAIESHAANHPWARHICANLEPVKTEMNFVVPALDPRKAVPGGRLDILVASPECTHHSIARGGRPRSDQSRATPWCILRWAEATRPKWILIENVREFRTWGPLGVNGKPLKRRKGETYGAFLTALRSLGYNVEDRMLCAADYGDPTTRERLFILGRRGKGDIPWPAPTHGRDGGALAPWRPARSIIDWQLPGKSIFNRKRPLAAATLERIATGLRKFNWPEAFLVMLYGTNDARSVDRPLPTVTAGGNHIGLAEPFLVRYQGSHKGRADGDRRVHGVDKPLPVQDTSNRYGLCRPFVLPPEGYYRGNAARSLDDPLQTITSRGGGHVVEPFLTAFAHTKGGPRNYPLGRPLPTQTGTRTYGMVEPFLLKYYRTGGAKPVTLPLDAITTRDRFALVDGDLVKLDILFRMLQPHELAAAMSFPAGYTFAGSRDKQVKQIGNAVPVQTAKALCRAVLAA